MKPRDWITIAALCILITSAYAFMQHADEQAAEQERAEWAGKSDR